MSDRTLRKRFDEDAGSTFVEVIRSADRPIRLLEIREILVGAGVQADKVNRQWKRLREPLKSHPNITKPNPALYEWSPAIESSMNSLQRLSAQAGKRGHSWLIQSWVDNLADALAHAETTGPRAQIGWSEQREQEKAAVVAEIAAATEMLVAKGASGSDILARLLDEAARRGLTPIGKVGDQVEFDKDLHEPDGQRRPRTGDGVRVRRSGFWWSGSGHPVVLVKALVE